MTTLPLKVKVAIRDHWTKEDSNLQQSLRTLQDALGLEIDTAPDWHVLLTELEATYTDKADAVAAVTASVEAWCRAATEIVDDSKNDDWTELLLEKLKMTWSRLRIFVDISREDDASTAWSEERGGFVVYIPRHERILPVNLQPLFQAELKDCFADQKQLPPYSPSPRAVDWSEVDMDTRINRLSVCAPVPHRRGSTVSSTGTQPPADFMPRADALPRPDDLLLKPPYHLMIYSRGAHEIEVQCSHAATLRFLADYFKRWRRTNHQPPAVEVRVHQCTFGMGASIDRLVLATEHKYGGAFILTPTIILNIVEGVLGYKPVYSDATTWTYRRDIELRT
ncbi:hypothetical protein CTA1_4766 [Colletotrichum tanaceti]|uniref:Uncharacterized protein n=1 Tax=Colletotrichum tanaceti TaxID=1306861 RepID=A0A4U6XWB7_9PEZI|nr:hypothetical protein CTA1_4766 [Colletotrichum tanaceti]